jgi:hypothetical protein
MQTVLAYTTREVRLHDNGITVVITSVVLKWSILPRPWPYLSNIVTSRANLVADTSLRTSFFACMAAYTGVEERYQG